MKSCLRPSFEVSRGGAERKFCKWFNEADSAQCSLCGQIIHGVAFCAVSGAPGHFGCVVDEAREAEEEQTRTRDSIGNMKRSIENNRQEEQRRRNIETCESIGFARLSYILRGWDVETKLRVQLLLLRYGIVS